MTIYFLLASKGFSGGLDGKESACYVSYLSLIPGSGRSAGEGKVNPFQFSCLGNLMDRGAWQATVHGVVKRVRHFLAMNTLTFIPIHFSSLIPKDVDVHSCHLLLDHLQFTLIQGLSIPGFYAILFFTASDFTFTTRHIHN